METYRVKFLQSAVDDLDEIILYIAKDSSKSALNLHDKIIENSNRLKEFPNMGRLVPYKKMMKHGFRMVVIEKYLLFYKIYDKEINILRILRGDRDYPSLWQKNIEN